MYKRFFYQIFMIDVVRHYFASFRYWYFVNIRRKFKTFSIDSEAIASNTIPHNIKGMKDLAVIRSLAIIKPLSVIETLNRDSKILTIGPRTEGEIFSLRGHGFRLKNITALDLISYSPWIEVGDMHNMSYADNSFDAVVMGWVIAYSEQPEVAAKEIVRVTKNGGIVAIGVAYGGEKAEKRIAKMGYRPGSNHRLHMETTIDLINSFFGDHVDHVYHNHPIVPSRQEQKGALVSIFSIKK